MCTHFITVYGTAAYVYCTDELRSPVWTADDSSSDASSAYDSCCELIGEEFRSEVKALRGGVRTHRRRDVQTDEQFAAQRNDMARTYISCHSSGEAEHRACGLCSLKRRGTTSVEATAGGTTSVEATADVSVICTTCPFAVRFLCVACDTEIHDFTPDHVRFGVNHSVACTQLPLTPRQTFDGTQAIEFAFRPIPPPYGLSCATCSTRSSWVTSPLSDSDVHNPFLKPHIIYVGVRGKCILDHALYTCPTGCGVSYRSTDHRIWVTPLTFPGSAGGNVSTVFSADVLEGFRERRRINPGTSLHSYVTELDHLSEKHGFQVSFNIASAAAHHVCVA